MFELQDHWLRLKQGEFSDIKPKPINYKADLEERFLYYSKKLTSTLDRRPNIAREDVRA